MKQENQLVLIFLGIFIAVVSFFIFFNSNSAGEENVNAKVALGETNYDWGDVGINDGNVTHTFDIKNEGSDPLELYNVVTSCMCTTATLKLGNEQSPEFGMHEKSAYVMKVLPGEIAQLNITFDPAFHGPSGVGPISRLIRVSTNDPGNSLLEFSLTANVTN